MISVSLDLKALYQGTEKTVNFTLAPGSIASDLRQIANTTIEQSGFDPNDVMLQWRDGQVWKPFETLEIMNLDRLKTKWMLKTSPNSYQEWPRINDIPNVAGSLKEHWQNRGVEERPNCEVSAWHSFLSSYANVPSDNTQKSGNFMALTSTETESASVEGGMPLPRGLSSSSGRRKAAVLLAVTKGKTLKLRFLPMKSTINAAEEEDDPEGAGTSGIAQTPSANDLRDPFGEFSGTGDEKIKSTIKLPHIN
jgi:hypothetical protein